uniref:Uncharacterized protein n=1 Tax=Cebus imitator TaxID=2715852 RepID=A0A2K5PAK8_CEBIM
MSSPQTPEDGQGRGGRGDPPGDLRSVLVTSVLNLELGPKGASTVPGGAGANRVELLGVLCEGHATWEAHLHLPGLLPAGPAQPPAAPALHAHSATARRAA